MTTMNRQRAVEVLNNLLNEMQAVSLSSAGPRLARWRAKLESALAALRDEAGAEAVVWQGRNSPNGQWVELGKSAYDQMVKHPISGIELRVLYARPAPQPEETVCVFPECIIGSAMTCCVKNCSRPAPQPEPYYSAYTLALLVAAGYVTQAKVDEARAIALNVKPGPLTPAPQPEGGVTEAMVEAAWGGIKGADIAGTSSFKFISIIELRAAIEAALAAQAAKVVEGFVPVPVDEVKRVVDVLRYASHPQPSPHADYLAGLLTAAQQEKGNG